MSHVCGNCGFPVETFSVRTVDVDLDLDDHWQACDPPTPLPQLHSEIAQIEALIKALRRKAVTLKKKINRFHGSPILRLPCELTSDIFTACLPEFEISSDHLSKISTVPYSTTPLVIGMVCSAWRELAWSTPQLWSNISLSLDTSLTSKRDLVKEWLVRSGQCQLSIHLNCNLDDEEDIMGSDLPSILDIMDIINGSSNRWSRIFFSLPPICYSSLESVRNHLPLLTFVSLHFNGDSKSWPGQPFSGFSTAPLLHHVEIHGYDAEMNLPPFDQLTRLSLFWITDNECVDILNCCPNLSHCTFMGILSGVEAISPTLASKIEYLELVANPANSNIGVLLDALIIPAVSELRINNGEDPLPHSNFLSLISRSACTLRRLAFTDCTSLESLHLCLQAVPSVTDFEFSWDRWYTTSTDLWILDRGERSSLYAPYLLPNLRTLTLSGAGVDFVALASMLSYRWRNEVLESIVVSSWSHDPNDLATVLPELRALISEGMKITLLDAGRRLEL